MTKDKVSIYIHWPFCKSKCPYCDFNSHVTDSFDTNAWIKAYKTEIDANAEYLSNKQIHTIFFGGGTPSLAPVEVIAETISHLDKNYDLKPDAEITMEANPTSVEAKNFKALSKSGLNRISLGVQSFDTDNLKFLGRTHTSDEALTAIELAAQNFSRFSFDLMYCLPQQTIKHWELELENALQLGAQHISLYQLTIEKGTKFFKLHKDKAFTLPDENIAADMYMLTEEKCRQYGLHAYEVSNYAANNHECLHNIQYWRMKDYLGIGPGAHSRLTLGNKKYARQNISAPNTWMQKVEDNKLGIQKETLLDKTDIRFEQIMMGLRLIEGIDINIINNPVKISQLVENGLLQKINKHTIAPTLQGRLLLNSVINFLIE